MSLDTRLTILSIAGIIAVTGCGNNSGISVNSRSNFATPVVAVTGTTVSYGGVAKVSVQMDRVFEKPIQLHVQTKSSSARSGVDYEPIDTDVTIPPGETSVSLPLITHRNSALNSDASIDLEVTDSQGITKIQNQISNLSLNGADYMPKLEGVTMLSCGSYHTCAAIGQNQMYCWGKNTGNQTYERDYSITSPPTTEPHLADLSRTITLPITTISAYDENQCVMGADSTYCSLARFPVATTGGLAVGKVHVCLIYQGNVECAGYNFQDQLGSGPSDIAAQFNTVSGINQTVIEVAAGAYTTCAIDSANALWCWGSNSNGQLGVNSGTSSTTTPANPIGLDSNVKSVVLGEAHVCALSNSGQAYCWGDNTHLQLGLGQTTATYSSPQAVAGGIQFSSLAAGQFHTCGIDTSNQLWCWGENAKGQLGNGTTTNQSVPTRVAGLDGPVNQVSLGYEHSCATVGSTNALRCWGSNAWGQTGVGVMNSPYLPTVPDALVGGTYSDVQFQTGSNGDFACAVSATGGTVSCWGDNFNGNLGRDSAGAPDPHPAAVTGSATGASLLALGMDSACAILDTLSMGQLSCWAQSFGLTPTIITMPGRAVANSTAPSHSCAVNDAGDVYCWGQTASSDNYLPSGKNGACIDLDSPQKVSGISKAVAISLGANHSCAVTATGQLYCWGADNYAQLGDGKISSTCNSTPKLVSLPLPVRAVAAAQTHTCALLQDGSVSCWGGNSTGQLGIGTTNIVTIIPVAVSGVSNATQISAGNNHTCVIIADGSVMCWGDNQKFQLGDPTADSAATMSATPVKVRGIDAGATRIHLGADTSCAIISNKFPLCWGNNDLGYMSSSIVDALKPMPVAIRALMTN